MNYSGALQHLDLYVSAQIFSNNQALCMPVKTSYRYIEKQPWVWDEWLTLPLKISDLPRNSQLAITAWDIESPQSGDVPVCAACISLFDKFGYHCLFISSRVYFLNSLIVFSFKPHIRPNSSKFQPIPLNILPCLCQYSKYQKNISIFESTLSSFKICIN